MASVTEMACQWSVLSLEITRKELQILSSNSLSTIPIVTVYAWPPLFTSRLSLKLRENRPLETPRHDIYFVRKKQGYTKIYADRPMSWFGQLAALRSHGYRHFLIDLSEGPHNQMKHFERLLSGFKRARPDEPYSLFNYDRQP
jgi:putative protease